MTIESLRLDRKEGLSRFLSRKRRAIELPPSDAFRRWSDVDKDKFNVNRLKHLGPNLVVPTATIREIIAALPGCFWLSVTKPKGRFGILLSGSPVSGKTTACLEAMRYFNRTIASTFPGATGPNSVPIVVASVPPGATGKSMIKRFANFLGLPVRDGDSLETLMQMVVPHMYEVGTRLLVIDEIQNLAHRTGGSHDAAQVLKDLNELVPAAFIYAGFNAETSPLLDGEQGRQIAGRTQLINLEPYGVANEKEAGAWNGLIVGFERRLGLFAHEPGTLVNLSKYLHDRTDGNIGSLNVLIALATIRIISERRDPADEVITRTLLDEIKIDAAAPNSGQPTTWSAEQ